MVGDKRQGWALFAAMRSCSWPGVLVCYPAEQAGNPQLAKLGLATKATQHSSRAAIWKERKCASASPLLRCSPSITTDASCGAVNSMHDSYTPLGGLVPLFNIQLGEVVFGGVGAGIKGMLLFAILAVFIAGLMVGRTPEYIGKKIEQKEVKMAMLALILMAANILVLYRDQLGRQIQAERLLESSRGHGRQISNNGPHGFSEILYAYTSANGNNGSAFAGMNANTPWYNLTLGLAMLIGRFLFIIPMLAVAGSLAAKKKIPITSGTLPTHGALFVGLLIGTVIIVGALTYFPALSLGPIVEHFLMQHGKLFSMVSSRFGAEHMGTTVRPAGH